MTLHSNEQIGEVLFIKNGDIGAFEKMVNAQIKQGWIIYPETYNYDHGLFTIMLYKREPEGDRA